MYNISIIKALENSLFRIELTCSLNYGMHKVVVTCFTSMIRENTLKSTEVDLLCDYRIAITFSFLNFVLKFSFVQMLSLYLGKYNSHHRRSQIYNLNKVKIQKILFILSIFVSIPARYCLSILHCNVNFA